MYVFPPIAFEYNVNIYNISFALPSCIWTVAMFSPWISKVSNVPFSLAARYVVILIKFLHIFQHSRLWKGLQVRCTRSLYTLGSKMESLFHFGNIFRVGHSFSGRRISLGGGGKRRRVVYLASNELI